ncbi:MAG: VanZ family protein [Candidatus Krumholzibacteriia bacterium]
MSGRWLRPWLLLGGWMLVIFGVSSLPDLGTSGVEAPGLDKIFHMCEYGVLGFLYARAGLTDAGRWRSAWGGALVGLVVGSLDELYQGTVPGREVDVLDTCADVAGAALGALARRAWTRRRQSHMLP